MELPFCKVKLPRLPVPARMALLLICTGADAANDPLTVRVERLFTVTPAVLVLAPVRVNFEAFVLSPTTNSVLF